MSVENPVNEVHPATLNWDEKRGQGIPGANPHFGGRMKLGTAVVALVIIAGALVLLTLAPSPTTPENQYVRIVDHSYSSSSFLLGGDSGPANPARLQMALAKYPNKSSVVVATWVLTLKREDQQFVREAWGYIVQPNISASVPTHPRNASPPWRSSVRSRTRAHARPMRFAEPCTFPTTTSDSDSSTLRARCHHNHAVVR